MSTLPPRASARDNPWYVLATITGEPTGRPDDETLQAANRKVWNSWASQGLSDEEKVEKSQKSVVDPFEGVAPWSEIRGRIEEKFENRLPDKEFPDPSGMVDFGNLSFEVPVSFKLFFFQKQANFSDATFTEGANFNRAIFTKAADFSDAKFTGVADFSSAEFIKDANFRGATFKNAAFFGGATFTKGAYFARATFTGRAYFGSASFTKAANFRDTSFTEDADFTDAKFTEYAWFSDATFTKVADFSWAKFTEEANFINATFTESAHFIKATFTEGANFRGAAFEGRSYFQGAEFKGSVDFTDASFDKPCNLREAKFTKEYPCLEGTNLHAKTTITADDGHWPQKNTDEKKDKEAMTSCAHLRHNMAAQGLPEHAHFFFRREMALKSQTVSGRERGWYWAYRISSNFGHSLWRPFLGLVCLCLFMAGVLCLVDCPTSSALNPLKHSFANMFPSFLFPPENISLIHCLFMLHGLNG